MPSEEITVSVRNLSKDYRLFGHPGDRVKQFLSLGLRHYHRKFTALKDISFDIRKGETIGIIGRNGSGKSTLLQLICGILKPSTGTVQVNGRVSALLELGAGFNPEFTGRENAFFQGALVGLSKSEMADRFDQIAAFADIGEFIEQPVRTYSSGMYVRLAFSVASHVAPAILVIDEALAVGDAQFQARCFEKFREFRAKGVTIILVTHSLDQILSCCDRVLLLDKGGLSMAGTPNEAVNAYRRLLVSASVQRLPKNTQGENFIAPAWSGFFRLNPGETRYGSLDTEIIEAGLFAPDQTPTQLLDRDNEYFIAIRLLCRSKGQQPIISFVIKDTKGAVLLGSNTSMENFDVGQLESGERIIVRFKLSMLLNPGSYFLSVGSQAATPDGSMVAHDHRADYLSFEVTGPIKHGIFSPPIVISMERERLS
ncbi:MAG: sugar ABC transporter ATP-binding protein [Betaproteobacteria bacterium]|nr:MAG: sugar ABC transporter ATP-binding protein [Betaproteobacteria bacterium]